MASNLLYFLLRLSISTSLADRDAFIEKVSKVIEQKTHSDPESAQQISQQIASTMEGLNETLLFKQLFAQKEDKKLNTTLSQLSNAVEKLNVLLDESDLFDISSKTKNDENN